MDEKTEKREKRVKCSCLCTPARNIYCAQNIRQWTSRRRREMRVTCSLLYTRVQNIYCVQNLKNTTMGEKADRKNLDKRNYSTNCSFNACAHERSSKIYNSELEDGGESCGSRAFSCVHEHNKSAVHKICVLHKTAILYQISILHTSCVIGRIFWLFESATTTESKKQSKTN